LKLRAYLAVSGQTLIAAATFLVAKDATALFSPLRVSWIRIVLSALLVLSVYVAMRGHPPRVRPEDRSRLALVGLLGVTANQMLFLFGLHLSTPLHAALLYAFTPVIVLGGAVVWLGERFSGLKVGGVALAVIGVMLVLTARGLTLAEGPLRGDLIILMAVFAWAGYTLVGKGVLQKYDVFTVIAWSFGFAALSVLPLTPWVWIGFDPADPGLRGWLEILYLSAMTSGVAFTLWYYALKHLEASRIAVFNNLQVPLTALFAWIVFGLVPGSQVILGGLLVVAGVTVVQLPLRRLSKPPSSEE
jgi:drug/metabolite transporter (DMT)-like permease